MRAGFRGIAVFAGVATTVLRAHCAGARGRRKNADEGALPKGVGRFTWLKVFEKATIESIYSQGDERYRPAFKFKKSKSASNRPARRVERRIGAVVRKSCEVLRGNTRFSLVGESGIVPPAVRYTVTLT